MSAITTHVLDVSRGRPASGLLIMLERQDETGAWKELARGTTDADGRLKDLIPEGQGLDAGNFRLVFDTGSYFRLQSMSGFYPSVSVVFEVKKEKEKEHYHVPLLLSPYGYSTYRGS